MQSAKYRYLFKLNYKALIVTGSEICLYCLIGCLAYMKIRNDIGDYKNMFIEMFAYLAMIM